MPNPQLLTISLLKQSLGSGKPLRSNPHRLGLAGQILYEALLVQPPHRLPVETFLCSSAQLVFLESHQVQQGECQAIYLVCMASEIQDVGRFPQVGSFISYARLVKCRVLSARVRKGRLRGLCAG